MIPLWYYRICSYQENYKIWIWEIEHFWNCLTAKQLNFGTEKLLKKHYKLLRSVTDSQLYWQCVLTQRLILQRLTLQKTWVQCDVLTHYMNSCPQLFIDFTSSQTVWIWFCITSCSAKLYYKKNWISLYITLRLEIYFVLKTWQIGAHHWCSGSLSFW